VTGLDDRDDHVKADGDDSNDFLVSFFEDSADLIKDSIETNFSLDSVYRERVSGTEIKYIYRLRAEQSYNEFIALFCAREQRSHSL
jgi:hypothetical protein